MCLAFTSMKGCLQTYLPACAVAPKKKENTEWVQLCVDLIETAVCFTFNINENDVFRALQVFWMIFTDVLAVLFARIALLKCLGSLKSKLFQAFRTPLDPMCITLWSQKILLIFCTSRLVWDYTNCTNRVERARRNWNNWWKLLNNELNSEAIDDASLKIYGMGTGMVKACVCYYLSNFYFFIKW